MDKVDLKAEAEKVLGNAYSPYSNFKVGAAILTEAGNIYTGCNVENVSYGLTICAERSAITRAIAVEGPDMKLREVFVPIEMKSVFPSPALPVAPAGRSSPNSLQKRHTFTTRAKVEISPSQ